MKKNPEEMKIAIILVLVGTIVLMYTGFKLYQTHVRVESEKEMEFVWKERQLKREEQEKLQKTVKFEYKWVYVGEENFTDVTEDGTEYQGKFLWFKREDGKNIGYRITDKDPIWYDLTPMTEGFRYTVKLNYADKVLEID